MADVDVGSLESALEAAYGDAPPAEKPQAPVKAQPEEGDFAVQEDPAELLQEIDEQAQPPAGPEPTFEVDVDGQPEVITGNERVKELLQRGLKAGRGFEENARVREALQAHVRQAQFQQQFHQAVSGDIVQIQALEQQLQGFEQVDWSRAYDTDPFNALKLKEQRDQLRDGPRRMPNRKNRLHGAPHRFGLTSADQSWQYRRRFA